MGLCAIPDIGGRSHPTLVAPTAVRHFLLVLYLRSGELRDQLAQARGAQVRTCPRCGARRFHRGECPCDSARVSDASEVARKFAPRLI